MAATSEKQINSFIKGLITESSPLTFPENASLDEQNFILNRDGSRERRLGVDFENDYTLNTTRTLSLNNSSFHEWKLSGGTSNIAIGVVRTGNTLWFLNMLDRAPSSSLLNGGLSIVLPALGEAPVATAVINNALILVSSALKKPYRLTYNPTTDTVTPSEYSIYVRDFWGVYDNLFENDRPDTLSKLHQYNLLNQGWSKTIQTVCEAPNHKDAIECTNVLIGVYPSNADIWSLGKVADSSSSDYEKYDPTIMQRNTHDFLAAPKGKHVIDVFNRGASREAASGVAVSLVPIETVETVSNPRAEEFPWLLPFTQVTTVTYEEVLDYDVLPQDIEQGSFSTVASFAGRVWYSGVRSSVVDGDRLSPNLSGYIFFSQTVINDEKISKCYQEADPTSDQISDIVDTDGGTVHIVDAINIVGLVPTKNVLLVFAENGVWQISGGEANFSATEYEVAKVSAIGCNSRRSIVAVDTEVFYWAKGGIFRISFNSVDGGLKSENLSLTSIQTFYNEIPEISRQDAVGVFEEKENTVRWLFNSEPNVSIDFGDVPEIPDVTDPEDGCVSTTVSAVSLEPDNQTFVVTFTGGVQIDSISGWTLVYNGVPVTLISISSTEDPTQWEFLIGSTVTFGSILYINYFNPFGDATDTSSNPLCSFENYKIATEA